MRKIGIRPSRWIYIYSIYTVTIIADAKLAQHAAGFYQVLIIMSSKRPPNTGMLIMQLIAEAR